MKGKGVEAEVEAEVVELVFAEANMGTTLRRQMDRIFIGHVSRQTASKN